ncbi:hypothetical protein V6C32_05490 [Desulforamulus ruminis]|uniref:hypothetical protein n=1 Tax=Desulforamulus ruminis TaxID=1564 RepID=UPI002FD9A462
MKKIFILFLSLVITVSMCGMSFASPAETILEQKDEITDLNLLWDRACEGLSDDKSFEIKAELKADSKDFISETKSTSQLLKKMKDEKGNIKSYYATTVFSKFKNPNKIASLNNYQIGRLVASSGRWDEKDPNTLSVTQVATYYYTKQILNGFTWIKPEKIICRWETSNLTAVSNGKYGCKWQGETDFDGGSFYYTSDEDYVTTSSITLGTSYTNTIDPVPNDGFVNCSNMCGYVEFLQSCKCTRGGSSWSFQSNYRWQYGC